MRRVGGDLNRVLVTQYLLFEDVRGHLSLAHETFGNAAAEIDYSRHARAQGNLRQVEHILNQIKMEIVFLFKARTGDAYGNPAVADPGAKDRHARFVSCRQNAVFRGNLCKFAAEQVKELAC